MHSVTAALLHANLSDSASWATIFATFLAIIGLGLVFYQLRVNARQERAQTTIQFQGRFKESSGPRGYLLSQFPLHRSLEHVMDEDFAKLEREGKIRVWEQLEDLTRDDKASAEAVIGALNDVAQYVADGMGMRSALQQYHTIFVRVGALLEPYILQRNATENGKTPARVGRRVMKLFNAGIVYHRCNPTHRPTTIWLRRIADTGEELRFKLLDSDGGGVIQFDHFPDSPNESYLITERSLRAAINQAERRLRR